MKLPQKEKMELYKKNNPLKRAKEMPKYNPIFIPKKKY